MRCLFLMLMLALAVNGFSIEAAAEEMHDPVPGAEIFKDDNAALRYLMAMGFMPTFSLEDTGKLRDINSLESYDNIPKKIRDKLDEATSNRTLSLLEFAANCKDCNFMPDQSYKPEDYVPPYRTLRAFARYLNAGAWKAIKAGEHEKGAKVLTALFRFGDDAENYGPLISYMIGFAIREIALDSMKNFIAGDFKPEAKEIVRNYLKSLTKPAFKVKSAIYWEKEFSASLLKTLDSLEGAIEIFKQIDTDESEPAETDPQNPVSQCNANQRVLMGALEMAAMDGIKFAENADFASIQQQLLQENYLRVPLVCPRKGEYKVKFFSEDEYTEVSCTCGADPEKPVPATEKAEKSSSEKESKIAAKARQYRDSGRFETDRKELLEYYDKILSFNQFQENALDKLEKIQAEYESKNNVLITLSAANFKSVFEKQFKLQKSIDDLIK